MEVRLLKIPIFADGSLSGPLFGESYIYEITASTKVLLEMTRHRDASYACKSSRYTLNRSEIVFEKSSDDEINSELDSLLNRIKEFTKTKKNDDLSLLLPQAYQYRWLVRMSPESLKNFFRLRCDGHAHYHIQDVAKAMYRSLPKKHRLYFQEGGCDD